jgi:hypothetical protein
MHAFGLKEVSEMLLKGYEDYFDKQPWFNVHSIQYIKYNLLIVPVYDGIKKGVSVSEPLMC